MTMTMMATRPAPRASRALARGTRRVPNRYAIHPPRPGHPSARFRVLAIPGISPPPGLWVAPVYTRNKEESHGGQLDGDVAASTIRPGSREDRGVDRPERRQHAAGGEDHHPAVGREPGRKREHSR